jgi:hypothetical protein
VGGKGGGWERASGAAGNRNHFDVNFLRQIDKTTINWPAELCSAKKPVANVRVARNLTHGTSALFGLMSHSPPIGDDRLTT